MHLLVNWANLILSDANYSSKSNKSKLGGARSLRVGGNTAAYNAGIGVSNWGGIRVMGSCLIAKVVKRLRASGTKLVSNLNNLSLNR